MRLCYRCKTGYTFTGTGRSLCTDCRAPTKNDLAASTESPETLDPSTGRWVPDGTGIQRWQPTSAA